MKRPDGFDPAAGPRPERQTRSAASTPVDRTGVTAEPVAEQETDVIELDAARLRPKRPGAGAPSQPSGSKAKPKSASASSTPARSSKVGAKPAATSSAAATATATLEHPDEPEDEAFLTPREAAKLRRRHERQEIRRFTARKRGRHRPWVIAAAILGVLIVVSLAGAYSPLLAVRSIEVVGASRVNQAEITEALSDQLGRPLALVDPGAVKAVLVGYPLIESYSLESQPPSTLVVRIVEREPVGVLQSGSVYTLVDAAGVTIERSDQPIAGYPTLMVTGGPTSKGFVAAAAVIRALPTDLRARVASVSASTADDVTLTLVDSPAEVVWGSAEDSAVKAVILAKTMAATDPSQVNQYDVSSPSAAIVR
ncbi:Cell division septal protein FtsQ [Plantibacter sp. VKM Ac-1784]|uniref:Cell division septal protein FtsQ n=1 Tax=Plantibacter elymi (nom. nud.) TaxID=199708 RepID=A0ABY1R9X9_9MICO|nr:FtsQ-type POTRA domain-containing protein [Plantibacter sp. VKM Ac-1784]SMQ66619.1 Cell division septal protein FtsQ [Plantibacter sp. VKM Ac-1784]